MKKLIILAAVVFGFAATSFAQIPVNGTLNAAQPQATFTASVNLQKALHIEKVDDLTFGTIYFPAAGGDVTIDADATAAIHGVNFYELQNNSKKAAKFTYGGGQSTANNHSYQFNIWDGAIELMGPDGHKLSFVPSAGRSNSNGSTSELLIYVGGTLTLPAGTTPGVYTSSNAVVSLNQQ